MLRNEDEFKIWTDKLGHQAENKGMTGRQLHVLNSCNHTTVPDREVKEDGILDMQHLFL